MNYAAEWRPDPGHYIGWLAGIPGVRYGKTIEELEGNLLKWAEDWAEAEAELERMTPAELGQVLESYT